MTEVDFVRSVAQKRRLERKQRPAESLFVAPDFGPASVAGPRSRFVWLAL